MIVRRHQFPAVVACALMLAGCAAPPRPAAGPRPVPRVELPDRLRVRTAGKIVAVNLESYVTDTILSEVSPVGEAENVIAKIFDAQAIIARSYAVANAGRHRDEGFDLCDSTHCQLYQPARRRSSRFAATAIQAAARTRSMVLTHDARPIEALFHADCGGATASADAVWGGNLVPYLLTKVDDLPDPTHRPWRVSATRDELRVALNRDSRTAVGRRLDSITIAARDSSGRAAGLSLRGERSLTVRGDVLRSVLGRGLSGGALLSTLFTIQTEGPNYTFTGAGFGHGVGLCQRGAATRLRRGESVTSVLAGYYTGTRLLVGF